MGRNVIEFRTLVHKFSRLIQLLEHHQIDFSKYDNCIANSQYPIIYAESWYLDIVTQKDWKVFVFDDYQMVMPIPFARLKRSFWKKSIVQPYACQQLGVFGQKEISEEIFNLFFEELTSLKPLVYSFNYLNNKLLKTKSKVEKRKNHVLELNDNYTDLFSNFSRSKRQRVKKSKKNELTFSTSTEVDFFIQFQKENMNLTENAKIISIKKELMQTAINLNIGKIYLIKDSEKKVIGVAFFIIKQNRIYYLQSASNEDGRKLLAMDGILNYIIEKYANSNYILDFEGSVNSGIAKFMSSFGAETQDYYVFK